MDTTQKTESGPVNPASTKNLRDTLVAKTIQLFGTAEVVGLADKRFPQIFQNSIRTLKINCQTEIIATRCGADSNLCALVAHLDDMLSLKRILANNEDLCKSVCTIWHRLVFVWINVVDWKPQNRALPGVLWISEGLLPAVNGGDATFDLNGFPLKAYGKTLRTFKFSDLKWLSAITEAFLLERTESIHGSVIVKMGPRKRTFNVETVAYFLASTLGLIFDQNTDQFLIRSDGQEPVPFSRIKLNEAILVFLHRQGQKDPSFRIAKIPVSAVVSWLKTITAVERPDESEGLKLYLKERLERRSGSDLTTHEILANYIEYCKIFSLPPYPECVFRTKLAKAIREQFALTRVHNVMRHHVGLGRMTARYGYNNLGIKANAATEVKDSKDVQEVGERSEGVIQ